MEVSVECLRFFAALIESETGIVYSEPNYYQLIPRIVELTQTFALSGPDELRRSVEEHLLTPEQRHHLIDAATNNETSFFRDRKVFEAIHEVMTTITSEKDTLKIWSAACSTGQESYSLAMTLLESKNEKVKRSIYSILASDISERVLAKATKGHYTELEIDRGLESSLRSKYFEQLTQSQNLASTWRAKKVLSEHIHFKKINLLERWTHSSKFDIVLCRNVLIYQNVENKRKVIQRIFDNLEPSGYLILGGAESLSGISEDFEHVPVAGAVVYRKLSA
ncbi:MAG: protein-glutamate O-methyltransferase CheR [Proteobacteria bacterium]|nr:MAG: protein-glutamate O-methyltransferase CheR [Pseudomonadota bacterium]